MKRPILVAGNWKMNHGREATKLFGETFSKLYANFTQGEQDFIRSARVSALVFPPFLSLEGASSALKNTPVQVGAQNVHFEEKGAFTGEISPSMLREIGIEWTLVGHSERRQYFGETDETVKKRATTHLKGGFKVVLCIGETRNEREKNETKKENQKVLYQFLI